MNRFFFKVILGIGGVGLILLSIVWALGTVSLADAQAELMKALNFVPVIAADSELVPEVTASPMPSTAMPTNVASPTTTATQTATATATSTATATATQTPAATDAPGTPKIETFAVFPGYVPIGQSATLIFNVTGSPDSVEISPDIGDVSGKSSASTGLLTENKVFVLTALKAGYAPVTANVVARVVEGNQVVVYDWNRPVTQLQRGFPRTVPLDNSDWTQPIDFASGTMYWRLEIRSQPVPQYMNLQYCIWQAIEGEQKLREMCGKKIDVMGTPGTVATWSRKIQDFSVLSNEPIDWTVERKTNGVAIKNQQGCAVTDLPGVGCTDAEGNWIPWGGEDPEDWYNLDWRFTAVIVAEGATFAGWDYFIGTEP